MKKDMVQTLHSKWAKSSFGEGSFSRPRLSLGSGTWVARVCTSSFTLHPSAFTLIDLSPVES